LTTKLGIKIVRNAEEQTLRSFRPKGAQQPPPFGPCLLWLRSPISAIAEHLFAQLTLLPTHQNPMHYNVFQSVRHPKNALSVRASTPHVIHVPWTPPPTQHSKLHLDRFSRFRTAHGKVSLYFTM